MARHARCDGGDYTVSTPRVEAFYWGAITFSQTLGTALGYYRPEERLRRPTARRAPTTEIGTDRFFMRRWEQRILTWARWLVVVALGYGPPCACLLPAASTKRLTVGAGPNPRMGCFVAPRRPFRKEGSIMDGVIFFVEPGTEYAHPGDWNMLVVRSADTLKAPENAYRLARAAWLIPLPDGKDFYQSLVAPAKERGLPSHFLEVSIKSNSKKRGLRPEAIGAIQIVFCRDFLRSWLFASCGRHGIPWLCWAGRDAIPRPPPPALLVILDRHASGALCLRGWSRPFDSRSLRKAHLIGGGSISPMYAREIRETKISHWGHRLAHPCALRRSRKGFCRKPAWNVPFGNFVHRPS
jgi:hypothetical protein